MNIRLSDSMLRDLKHTLDETERRGDTLQAYREAARIQARNPLDNVALEDIVDALIRGSGRILAVELEPPGSLEVTIEDRPRARATNGEARVD